MTQTGGWDLASSVGVTATMVAAARALASQSSNAIIDDPYAAPLVRAVGLDFFRRLVDGEVVAPSENGKRDLELETASIAVRTRYFDDFFLNPAADGIRQSVILASGLDARAYRLAWPSGSVVYEVDQPKIVAFKADAMADLRVDPTAELRTVCIDLREDWPAALREAGFDVMRPTSWCAEGLLIYLPPAIQDELFDRITALSAPGSRLATEYHGGDSSTTMSERARQFNERWANIGCDVELSALFFEGERRDVADYLTKLGWQVDSRPRRELFGVYGLDFSERQTAVLRNIILSATLA